MERRDIMKTSFTFNEETSAHAMLDREQNFIFIAIQEDYINDLLKARGYIYLNQIYEMFGVKWRTEWENLCITYEPGVRIELAVARDNGNGFDIDIL
jgi:hypothetical protein